MIVLLNGPPGCGKDTVAEYICSKYNFVHLQFKKNLIEVTKRFLNIKDEHWDEFYRRKNEKFINLPNANQFEFFENTQGFQVVLPLFSSQENLLSPREFMIIMAEKVLKPVFGKGIFAKNLLTPGDVWNRNFVISDLGFEEEIDQITEETGAVRSKITIIRIEREGCSFVRDSRTWVTRFNVGDIFFGDFGERLYSEIKNPETFLKPNSALTSNAELHESLRNLEFLPEFTEESSNIIKENFKEAPFEYEITNNGTLEELYKKIDKILTHLEYHEKIIWKFLWKELPFEPYLKT